jgi:hypothetical protein
MGESRRERRARERWARDMHRALEELDRLDRQYGLGAMPPQELGGEPLGPPPRHRRPPRIRRRRSSGPVLPGLLVVLALLVFVAFKSPTATGERLRRFVDDVRGTSTYAFVLDGPGNRPVGWDPCQDIHYVVNPDGAPSDWEDVVDSAVEEVEDASGFDFTYDGETDDRNFGQRPVADGEVEPVLIAWADPTEEPKLAGKAVGIGGSTPAQVGNRVRFVAGLVVLDAEAADQMRFGGRSRAQELILAHELGHVLGLDHVDDSGELMNPEYVGQNGFGEGDERGLRILNDQPCG